MADLRARIHGAVPQIRADLERLVAIPSVSARDFDPEPLRRSADTVAEMLREVGAET
ncbi:MAG: dipeptidase, partial [Chloroflexi bacterium]